MTARQEAYALIDALPDESVRELVLIIKNMTRARYPDAKIKLDLIEKLEDNWNGNEAPAFSKKHIEKIREIVNALDCEPEVFPTAADTIQLEFDGRDGSYLEIDIPENGQGEYLCVNSKGEEKTGMIDSVPAAVSQLVRSFHGSEV